MMSKKGQKVMFCHRSTTRCFYSFLESWEKKTLLCGIIHFAKSKENWKSKNYVIWERKDGGCIEKKNSTNCAVQGLETKSWPGEAGNAHVYMCICHSIAQVVVLSCCTAHAKQCGCAEDSPCMRGHACKEKRAIRLLWKLVVIKTFPW